MGLFDFDGDGKTSAWESFLEYSLFEEFANKGTGEKGIGLFADDDDDWRDDCEDGSAYDVDPWDYDSREEYEEALEDARLRSSSDGDDDDDDETDEEADDEDDDYDDDDDDEDNDEDDVDWRDDCEDGFDYDIDPWDYDSREEYEKALKNAKRGRKSDEENDDGEDDEDDDDEEVSFDFEEVEVYIYCQVGVPGILKTYSYLTDDETLEPGDRVVVPFGRDNEERAGTVMSVSRYTAENAPYPVEKTKWILRRLIGGRQDMEEYRITKPMAAERRAYGARKKAAPTDRGESGSPLRRLILWLEQNGRSAEEIVDCLKTVL